MWLTGLREAPPLEGVLKGRAVFIKKESECKKLVANGCFGNRTVPRRLPSLPVAPAAAGPVGTHSRAPAESGEPATKRMRTEGERSVGRHGNLPVYHPSEDQSRWLQLFPEETLYLLQNDCLSVTLGSDDNILSFPVIWGRISSWDRQLASRYTAYWHLRSQGWVVKHGLKFGADFLVYKSSPSHYHASYALAVRGHPIPDPTLVPEPCDEQQVTRYQPASELLRPSEGMSQEHVGPSGGAPLPCQENLELCKDNPEPSEQFSGPSKENIQVGDKISGSIDVCYRESPGLGLGEDHPAGPSPQLSWRQVVGMVRVNESAGKGLVVCDITSSPLSGRAPPTDDNMKEADILYTVVKRWLPQKNN